MSEHGHKLVQLANGTWSLHSLEYGETFHPGGGPAEESEELYARQLRLRERLQSIKELVIWDVGLGAASNAMAVLGALQGCSGTVHLLSFDSTLEPLRFAVEHADRLGVYRGYEAPIRELLANHRVQFTPLCSNPLGGLPPKGLLVHWELRLDDFPTALANADAAQWPKPHAILYDPYSPAKNPAMWTLPVFQRLAELLPPSAPPCLLATYSRSTLIRSALLLAGFFVGQGMAVSAKEETTVASNRLDWLECPLEERWLARVRRSHSAEPLTEPVYRCAPLTDQSWQQLQRHPQFQSLVLRDILNPDKTERSK